MALALERHATSKLPDEAIEQVATLGFRGEALPSIASVARLTLESRVRGAEQGWKRVVDHGALVGGRARRAAAGHAGAGREPVRQGARAAQVPALGAQRVCGLPRRGPPPGDGAARHRLHVRPRRAAHSRAAGRGRARQRAWRRSSTARSPTTASPSTSSAASMRLTGIAGLPTFNRGVADHQYLFVNGRPVKDRLLAGAVRGAYAEMLARDRHAVLALFLELPPEEVDVNVHPAKTEVRFRDAAGVRGFIVSGLRQALATGDKRSAQAPDAGGDGPLAGRAGTRGPAAALRSIFGAATGPAPSSARPRAGRMARRRGRSARPAAGPGRRRPSRSPSEARLPARHRARPGRPDLYRRRGGRRAGDRRPARRARAARARTAARGRGGRQGRGEPGAADPRGGRARRARLRPARGAGRGNSPSSAS